MATGISPDTQAVIAANAQLARDSAALAASQQKTAFALGKDSGQTELIKQLSGHVSRGNSAA